LENKVEDCGVQPGLILSCTGLPDHIGPAIVAGWQRDASRAA